MRQTRIKKENHFEKIMISKDLATILSRISFRDSKITRNNKIPKNFNVSLQNQFPEDNNFKIEKQRITESQKLNSSRTPNI